MTNPTNTQHYFSDTVEVDVSATVNKSTVPSRFAYELKGMGAAAWHMTAQEPWAVVFTVVR